MSAKQLARIEAGLRLPQTNLSASLRAGDRRAIVAAVLRQPALRPAGGGGGGGCDLLFVLRSVSPGSRWSGQVAFPGGHAEGDESDHEAVARECLEEVGLQLDTDGPTPSARLLGRVADRVVYRPEKTAALLVRCYVYEQLRPQPELSPDGAEVAACGWAPLACLLTDALVEPLPERAGGGSGGTWAGFSSVSLGARN
jgi:8-oxo-dGTP pyrophosphatase MutT (NUDIX family)